MISNYQDQLKSFLKTALLPAMPDSADIPDFEIEIPKDKQHGDFATNMAMKCARILRKPPMAIAGDFCVRLNAALEADELRPHIGLIEAKAPGFINFHLSPFGVRQLLAQILEQKEAFGRSETGGTTKLQIEFVSANPTGPLSVAHARQAAVGDALGNILSFIGYDVTKEYYLNDEGNQINLLGRSIQVRALQECGQDIAFPEDGYQGDYICDMAHLWREQNGRPDAAAITARPLADFAQFGVEHLTAIIRGELEEFGVRFDVWTRQSVVATEAETAAVLAALKDQGHVFEEDGALWFRSTQFGDDKDRVVRKSDGSYTYFSPDIAYHKQKFARGFQRVYNIWGPDHHGYIPRLTAAVQALGHPAGALEVLIVQLATIYRGGQPVLMSTRRGQYISLREVIDEVGVDAARFFFLMRHIKAPLDFDLDLAKQETAENPVFYIQYAHARIHSVKAKAEAAGMAATLGDGTALDTEADLDLIKKLGHFPDILVLCDRDRDPYALATYLLELAGVFHKFYDQQRIIDAENPARSEQRLALLDAVRIVLANGLRLIGVAVPEQM